MFLIWSAGTSEPQNDVGWVKNGGGMNRPRSSAGQKVQRRPEDDLFWISVFGGGLVIATGFVLLFPFYGTTVADMELAEIVHSVVAVLYVSAMFGHIYIGTIGMEGAFEAMGTGEVDLNWAKEHHSLWLEDETAKRRAAPRPPAMRLLEYPARPLRKRPASLPGVKRLPRALTHAHHRTRRLERVGQNHLDQ